jgi:poly(3-hydroxybutyrate) depolymerase
VPGEDGSTTDGGSAADAPAAVTDGAASDAPATDAANAGPGPGPTQQCTFTKDAQGFFKLTSAKSDYWVRLPVGYDPVNPQPAPLLVAIHGCGDTAYNFATWGAAPYALRATQDYIAISIGGRDGQCWTLGTDGPIVTEAITHVRSCFYAHQKKIVLAGYSSGGQMAYALGMKNAAAYAGLLIENSGLSQGVGSGNVDTALAGAAWKINVAHSARTEDASFPIAGVRADRDKMLAATFPLQYRELAGTHDGSTDDWALFLIPKMASWAAP